MKIGYLVLIFALLVVSCAKEKPHVSDSKSSHSPADSDFTFVQISDTHLKEERHFNRTEQVIYAINHFPKRPDFVIHTGDIMMDNIMDQEAVKRAKELFSKLSIPIHFVPGNHDILASNPQKTKRVFEVQFGPLIKTFLHKKVRFLLLYTEALAGRVILLGYSPISAMSKLLKRSSMNPVLLFHHAPSSPDFYNNRFHYSWSKDTVSKWTKHLVQHNVRGVFAGHFHRDELQRVGSIPLYVAPAVASYWGRQASFRVYRYNNGRITYRTHYINAK